MDMKNNLSDNKPKCKLCDYTAKNNRALAGHMWFAHQKRVGWKAEMSETISLQRVQILELTKENLDLKNQVRGAEAQLALAEFINVKCEKCGAAYADHKKTSLQGSKGVAFLCPK